MFRRSMPVATHPAHNSFFRIDRPIPPNVAQTRTCTSYRRPRREIECGGRTAGAHRSKGTGARGPSGHPSASKSSRSDLIESCSGMQQGRPWVPRKGQIASVMVLHGRLCPRRRPRNEDTAAASGLTHLTAATTHYSMTSSARPSSATGTSTPSALAVLRLITSSTLVTCCTGRSAGFSPFRIRPA
jgi:hypothetical protein